MEYFLYSLRHGSSSAEDLWRFLFTCFKDRDKVEDMVGALFNHNTSNPIRKTRGDLVLLSPLIPGFPFSSIGVHIRVLLVDLKGGVRLSPYDEKTAIILDISHPIIITSTKTINPIPK